jgi:hypothetical protein
MSNYPGFFRLFRMYLILLSSHFLRLGNVKLSVKGNDKLFATKDIHFGANDIHFGKRQIETLKS